MTEATAAGERLVLLPERAVYWPRAGTLFVADLHAGKEDAFRAAAVPVPGDPTGDDLKRLGSVLDATGAERLIVLGDFWHARAGRTPAVLDAVAGWRNERKQLAVELVRGNHDRSAGDPPAEWDVTCRDEPAAAGPFALCHHPGPSDAGYVLAGHLHPAVTLRGAGRQRLRLACFWFGARVGVLPAFGRFTGSADVTPAAGDGVYVLADGEVIRLRNSDRGTRD